MLELKEKQDLPINILNILSKCSDALRKIDPAAKLVLYGSYATGSATAESDLDLLILVNGQLTAQKKKQIRNSLYEISLENDIVISAIIKSISAWDMPMSQAMPIYNNIQHYGIAL